MRIGITLFQFFPGRIGGAGDYIERLIPGLLRTMAPEDELILLGNPENLGPFKSLDDHRLQLVTVNWSRRWIQVLRFLDLALPFSPSHFFARQFNRLRIEILHCPQQSIFPRGITAPTVVTVVDLLHLRCPQFVSLWQRWLRTRKESHLIRNCDHTISISQATRSDLIEFYPISPEKCSVAYLGGKTSTVHPVENPVPAGAPYIYFPANSYPHKNHARMISAFRQFRIASPNPRARLVLSGQCSNRLKSTIQSFNEQGDILHLGYISKDQVAAVYAGCRAVMIPSLFEGFGMPLVEGIGYNRPVYCSDLVVFRELAGDLVKYFNPTSDASLIAAFSQILHTDPPAPDSRRVAEILGRLNWDQCAQETYTILKQTCSKASDSTG